MDGPVMNDPVHIAFHQGSQIMKKKAMEQQSEFSSCTFYIFNFF